MSHHTCAATISRNILESSLSSWKPTFRFYSSYAIKKSSHNLSQVFSPLFSYLPFSRITVKLSALTKSSLSQNSNYCYARRTLIMLLFGYLQHVHHESLSYTKMYKNCHFKSIDKTNAWHHNQIEY